MELTVDTCIFVNCNEFDNDELLLKLRKNHTLVIDLGREILRQYQRNGLDKNTGALGSKTLAYMLKNNKVVFYSDKPTSKTKACLNGLRGFHNDDHIFVIVAEHSSDKHLVSEDSDYSPQVKDQLLKKLGITTYTPIEFNCRH